MPIVKTIIFLFPLILNSPPPLSLFLYLLFFTPFELLRINSDGGGRSGVYIAIDANLELAEEEDCFHVFGYLKKLRQARKGLIENVVCYLVKFIASNKFADAVTNLFSSTYFRLCAKCVLFHLI